MQVEAHSIAGLPPQMGEDMMKHRFTNMAAVLLVAAARAGAQIVEIPDAALEEVVRHHLDKPAGDILRADMEGITVLDASATGRRPYATLADGAYPAAIRSLEGIEAAINLKVLDFSNTEWGFDNVRIEDLSPLGALANLETLDFRNSGHLGAVTVPEGLVSLRWLDMSGTVAGSFFLPVALPNLEVLILTDCSLNQILLPPGLSNLTSLDVSNNQLAQVDLPDGMRDLVELNLGHNALVHFRFPEGLDSLRRLYLGWNQLTGLELPEFVSQLTRLDLHGMPSLYGLGSLPSGWLDAPESMSNLWVRFGYSGMYSGCGPGYYFRPVYLTYLGITRHRIADLRMRGTGDVELTVAGEVGDRLSVEYTEDAQFWYHLLDFVIEDGVEVVRVPHFESAPVLYRLRLLPPVGGGSWPYVPPHGGGGGEE